MYSDGVCAIGGGYYSKTIKFADINYTSASREAKISVFSKYCTFLNSFDSSIHAQLTIFNRHTDIEFFKDTMLMPMRGDEFDLHREEANQRLLTQVDVGENNVIREKYITLTIKAETYASATTQLRRLTFDAINHFKKIGVEGYVLSGGQRLELMSKIMRPNEKFIFDYDRLIESGLSTKDFIVPEYFDFSDKSRIQIDGHSYTQTLNILDLPTEIADNLVSDLMEIPTNLTFNMHLVGVEKESSLKIVKQKLAGMHIQKRDEIKRQIKDLNGVYDESLLPENLVGSMSNAQKILDDLKEKNQKMFKATILININASSLDELNSVHDRVTSILNRHSCKMIKLIDYQEKALNATLPIGRNDLEIQRTLMTSSVGIFMPFTTQELFHEDGIFYGLNQASKNLIFLNRKNLMNANGFILAKSGSGKSVAAKTEMEQVLLTTADDVIVIDPEREYSKMAKRHNGEVIDISSSSRHHINPFDITMNYSDGDNPIAFKSEFILSLLETVIGGRGGLTSASRGIIDRVVRLTYEDYFKKPTPERMPTFKEFYSILKRQPESESFELALALEIYVEGSLNLFSHQTNVDINNRFLIYDIKDLGSQLMSMGLLIALDQVWNRITSNRKQGKRTWIYIDEIYLLFKNEYSADYLFKLYKRARKWGGIPTGITQNVEDLLLSDTARRMLSNSEYVLMLAQATPDKVELAELFNLSDEQLEYVTDSQKGCGLLLAGSNIVPFDNRLSEKSELFKAVQTDVNRNQESQLKEENHSSTNGEKAVKHGKRHRRKK